MLSCVMGAGALSVVVGGGVAPAGEAAVAAEVADSSDAQAPIVRAAMPTKAIMLR